MIIFADTMAEMRETFRLLSPESRKTLLDRAKEFYRGQEQTAASRQIEDSGAEPEAKTGLNSHEGRIVGGT
ncbi:MAG: hypothetical protein FWD94_08340 [Treponema sp.]|nr:hypothetical protein [Treponema sp.]